MNVYYDECGLFRATTLTLHNIGFNTREEILQGVLSGKLVPGRWRRYGKKTHQEVLKWLGMEIPENTPKNMCLVCPVCGTRFHKS